MVQEIKSIVCPKCKSDGLKQVVVTTVNAVYYPQIICKAGYNVNINRGPVANTYLCMDCGEHFTITDNVRSCNPCVNCTLECKDRKKVDE